MEKFEKQFEDLDVRTTVGGLFQYRQLTNYSEKSWITTINT